MYGTLETHWTWLHKCPSHFLIFWKMMDMVRTQRDTVGTRPIPKKKKLKCAIPLTPLLLLQFLDLFIFYGFSPFALFSLFCPCVLFIVSSSYTLSHMKSSFVSTTHVNKLKMCRYVLFKKKKNSFMIWSPPPIKRAIKLFTIPFSLSR